MKKSSFIAAIILAVTFNACSSKGPEVSTGEENVNATDTSSVGNETSGVKIDKEEIISDLNNANGTVESRLKAISSELGSIYFDFDKYDLKSSQEEKINNGANLLKASNNSGINLKVEGNCDEWGTDEYNYALGLKRAKSVKDALIAQGVAKDRINIISYGESNPKCTSKNQECWKQNRRVDFQPLP